jgi:arsenite-transporting ATPase
MSGFDLDKYRLVVCLGPGGVGKTTLSATLALGAASGGRSTDVMTIDPAPRLLDALGVKGEAHEPQTVELSGKAARLRALKLDPKRTFDELIMRYAPSQRASEAILAGRIYQSLSRALAGVADYMAMERVLALSREGAAELIVLDTPPATDALRFLDAPQRMLELLNSRAAALLGASRGLLRGPQGVFDLAARTVLTAFDRLTGLHLLSDIHAFVRSFDGMYEGFATRAAAMQKLLRAEDTAIVLVTIPERERIEQIALFLEALERMQIGITALVVNRLMKELPSETELTPSPLTAGLRGKASRNLADFAALKQRETLAVETLRERVPATIPLMSAPDLGYEPRALHDLAAIAANLSHL